MSMLYIPKIGDYLEILTDNEIIMQSNILLNILNLRKKKCILNFVKNIILDKLLNHFISF